MLQYLSKRIPDATARIRGLNNYRGISGMMKLYQTRSGVFVVLAVQGMPENNTICNSGVFAVHIHDGSTCSEMDTGPHYNPDGCVHPYHAGDLPPIFADNGFGWYAMLTQRFSIDEVISKTVVIHANRDDFTTQPSGDSGDKIACGIIKRVE